MTLKTIFFFCCLNTNKVMIITSDCHSVLKEASTFRIRLVERISLVVYKGSHMKQGLAGQQI